MTYLYKYKPTRSKKYINFVKSLPCVASNAPADWAHHVIDCGLGGVMGGKVSDLFTIPLTDAQHKLIHHNVKAWEERNGPQILHVLKTLEKAEAAGLIEVK